MPAPNYTGFAGVPGDISIGAGADESGVLLGDIDWDIDNPNVEFRDRFGGRIGFAENHDAALQMTITGEVDDKDAGLNVITYVAAATVANADFFSDGGTPEKHHGLDFNSADNKLMSASGGQPQGGARALTVGLIRPIGFTFAA